MLTLGCTSTIVQVQHTIDQILKIPLFHIFCELGKQESPAQSHIQKSQSKIGFLNIALQSVTKIPGKTAIWTILYF